MKCARCATPIPDNSQFCLACGVNLATAETAGAGAVTADGALELLRMLRAETADDFEIEREIGRGGMAVVYLATDIHLHRKVAVKVLPPELTFGPGAIERFRREARTAAALDHPHIIPIYRVSASGRLFWYAMKYLEGQTLQARLDHEAQFTFEETIGVLDAVADALDYAHARGIVHRDIKPSNIIIDDRGWLTIADFGIAKEVAAGPLTGSGSWLGSPTHMSPEQCTGGDVSGTADQYAVGVLAYQLLSGLLPVEASTLPDLLYKHRYERPVPLETLRPGLPKPVYAAVERALAKSPGERFRTVREFVDAVAHGTTTISASHRVLASPRGAGSGAVPVVSSSGRPETDRSTATIPMRAPRRMRRVTAVAGAVVIAAAGIALWWRPAAVPDLPPAQPSAQAHTQDAAQSPATASQPPATAPTTSTTPPPTAAGVFAARAGGELRRVEQWVRTGDRAAVRRVFGEAETARIWRAIGGRTAITAAVAIRDTSAPDSSASFALTVRDARRGTVLVSGTYSATFVPVPDGVRIFTASRVVR